MRILLVEDEPSAARFIAKGLREATYAVDVAADGVTAAERDHGAYPDSRLARGAGPELDAVATSFNSVLDRLGSALATQREFRADASHELRTPISTMRTAADVTLSQSRRDEAEYREALAAVAQQSARLARLVDDMLVLARADAGGYPMVRGEVDVDAIVDDCVREFSARALAKQIRLTGRVPPACRSRAGSRRRMAGRWNCSSAVRKAACSQPRFPCRPVYLGRVC